jgi:hypothetical protein
MSRSKAAATAKQRVKQTTLQKRWMIVTFEMDGDDVHGHVDCWQWPNTKFKEAISTFVDSVKKIIAQSQPRPPEPQRDTTSGW